MSQNDNDLLSPYTGGMSVALILSGAGRYADPWHPFPRTSPLLADIARNAGWDVDITEDIDERLAAGLDDVDLLIINAGDPWRSADEATPAHPLPADEGLVRDGILSLDRGFARGISVLGIHSAASSLRDYPRMREGIAGEWAPGHSWHPPLSELVITPTSSVGLDPFTVEDERYTDLIFHDDVEVMANCIQEEGTYPLVWQRTFGLSKVIVDALGHDERSYLSDGHVGLLTRIFTILLES